jgi:hypothetical protein
LRCVTIRVPSPRFFSSALHAVAGFFEERPAADQPARQLLLDLVLRNIPRPVFKAAFVIAKPHPIGY